jgi:hypothetical protein
VVGILPADDRNVSRQHCFCNSALVAATSYTDINTTNSVAAGFMSTSDAACDLVKID